MNTKIQLIHPAGKKAVKMDIKKYEILKKEILFSLQSKEGLSHSEILQSIKDNLVKKNINFEGSIQWYMQSVKMDLEAKNIIHKNGQSPAKYTLT